MATFSSVANNSYATIPEEKSNDLLTEDNLPREIESETLNSIKELLNRDEIIDKKMFKNLFDVIGTGTYSIAIVLKNSNMQNSDFVYKIGFGSLIDLTNELKLSLLWRDYPNLENYITKIDAFYWSNIVEKLSSTPDHVRYQLNLKTNINSNIYRILGQHNLSDGISGNDPYIFIYEMPRYQCDLHNLLTVEISNPQSRIIQNMNIDQQTIDIYLIFIMLYLGLGLYIFHRLGYTHLDMHSKNIFIKKHDINGTEILIPIIADFGIARKKGGRYTMIVTGEHLNKGTYFHVSRMSSLQKKIGVKKNTSEPIYVDRDAFATYSADHHSLGQIIVKLLYFYLSIDEPINIANKYLVDQWKDDDVKPSVETNQDENSENPGCETPYVDDFELNRETYEIVGIKPKCFFQAMSELYIIYNGLFNEENPLCIALNNIIPFNSDLNTSETMKLYFINKFDELTSMSNRPSIEINVKANNNANNAESMIVEQRLDNHSIDMSTLIPTPAETNNTVGGSIEKKLRSKKGEITRKINSINNKLKHSNINNKFLINNFKQIELMWRNMK